MRLAESLKRDAALSDYEGAAAAADAASDELRRRTQAALARLRARARAAPSAAASGGRHNACCVLIGERVVELDADADVEHGADVDHALLRVAAM